MITHELLQELLLLTVEEIKEVSKAILPILAAFLVFQFTILKLPFRKALTMCAGLGYAFIGLMLFFIGVNIGFTGTGRFFGEQIAALPNNLILIPIGMVMGFSVVLAEPTVRSLVRQVETVTGGTIHRSAIFLSLCIGVALSVGLAMARIIWHINFWVLIIPGYALALIIAMFSPKMFTAISFDGGGVATGPMMTTFVMSFAVGVSSVVGNGTVLESFGLVSMVAMIPIITMLILGLIYQHKSQQAELILQNEDDSDEYAQLLDDELFHTEHPETEQGEVK